MSWSIAASSASVAGCSDAVEVKIQDERSRSGPRRREGLTISLSVQQACRCYRKQRLAAATMQREAQSSISGRSKTKQVSEQQDLIEMGRTMAGERSSGKNAWIVAPMDLHEGDERIEVAALNSYLVRFGYLSVDAERKRWTAASIAGLRRFQSFCGMTASGELDSATARQISQPRCGLPDEGPSALPGQNCRLDRTSPKTYFYINFPVRPNPRDVAAALARAFASWGLHLPFEIVQKAPAGNERRDFWFAWSNGEHGDGKPFDGPGAVLAHAFYPCGQGWSGQCHFDTDETWGFNWSDGGGWGKPPVRDIETVALHEIGHLLGLEHSNNAADVMYAYLSGERRQLSQNDVLRIRALYPKHNELTAPEDAAVFRPKAGNTP